MDQTEHRVFLRPIASPFSLGLLGLAGASIVSAALQLKWVGLAERRQVALIVLVCAPLPQLIASVFGHLARDPVVATGMGWLSATWLAYALVQLATPPGSTSAALGAFLVLAGAGVAVSAVEAARSKLVPALVLAAAAARFVLSGVWELTHAIGWQKADGVLGIVTCVAALYAAAALAIEDLELRTVLPTGRHGAGREALAQGEAGVRPQL
jgi:succinate-acetate transporter protein